MSRNQVTCAPSPIHGTPSPGAPPPERVFRVGEGIHMEIEQLAAYPLWKIYRARRGWRAAGNADLVALADAAIERRIAIVGGCA